MSIADKISNAAELKKPLTALINQGGYPVGGIYHLDYDSAIVLTDDFKKQEAGGVPRAGFLLAVAGRKTDEGFVLEDQEIILLRVRGTAPLPNESQLVQTRLAVVRDAGSADVGFDEVTDVLTRNELQQSAFDCQVVGTFYTEDDKADSEIRFGADIDNVMVSAKYQVYLPSPKLLSWLASYPSTTADDTLVIGTVRFAATRRRAILAETISAEVRIHVSDFVGRKTAVFGMTRTGKSNTIKTLVTSVHRFASEHQRSIGQLIFDPQGEYANINTQDGTGLRLLGDDDQTVRIYKVNPSPSEAREKNLRFNFYDRSILDAVWSLVCSCVADSTTDYSKTFRSVDLTEPDSSNHSQHNRWEWSLIALYGLLAKVSFQATSFPDPGLFVSIAADKAKPFMDANAGAFTEIKAGRYRINDPKSAQLLADWVGERPDDFPKWHDADSHFKDIYGVYKYSGVTSRIRTIRDFHSADSSGDVGDHLWNDMNAGRLAIVDLSVGNEQVTKVMSERIVTHLLNQANDRFRSHQDPVAFQIVVEEAHNLFERSGGRNVADDPWVRLSKEAAKYEIGLIYATQEVTSVDKRILSNTSNWLIAHLNSDHETRELSHYYDFAVWAPSLIKVEDVGFVRMKTYSGKYVVPVQIAKFDHAMLNGARVAAGLAEHELEPSGA